MKLIYSGDVLAAVILDSEMEIEAAKFALNVANSKPRPNRSRPDLGDAIERMVHEINAPAPQ